MAKEIVVGALAAILITASGFLLAACDNDSNPLAPYEGSRPLIIQRVTQSATPDLQWVGGRAAAVGVNRGERAALDSTLVWLKTSNDNSISAPMSIDSDFDREAVARVGGVPLDSLGSGEVFTVWVAEKEAFDGELNEAVRNSPAYVDTTLQLNYLFSGRSGGGERVNFRIVRDQGLVRDRYRVEWTPDVGFRRMAIRDASTGGFSDLLWHILVPDESDELITSPVVIGQPPEHAIEVTEWAGWTTQTQILWAVTDDWDGNSFSPRAQGYSFFTVFNTNFE